MAQPRRVDLTTIKGREKVYLEIVDHLNRYNDAEKRFIAIQAGVAYQTLYNWCALRTWSPQIRTLASVARALGYDIVLKRQRPAPPKLQIVQNKPRRKKH